MINKFTHLPTSVQSMPAQLGMHLWHNGIPALLISDQGKKFESSLWWELAERLGIKLIRTTAYHSQSNGIVENFYRTLKIALRASNNGSCLKTLSIILLGRRFSFKKDWQASAANMMYEYSLRIPCEFLSESMSQLKASNFLKSYRQNMSLPRPTEPGTASSRPTFITQKLKNVKKVFIHNDSTRRGLQLTYFDLFKFIKHYNKSQVIDKNAEMSLF